MKHLTLFVLALAMGQAAAQPIEAITRDGRVVMTLEAPLDALGQVLKAKIVTARRPKILVKPQDNACFFLQNELLPKPWILFEDMAYRLV